ncbi:MAG: spermidine/putrescine ABC transporter [Ethanoligenens sp.]
MRRKPVVSIIILCVIGVFLVVPLIAMIGYSFFDDRGFTLQFYQSFLNMADFLPMLANSIWLSVVSVVLCMVILLLALFAVLVYAPGLEKYLQILCMIPYSIQGVILATSLLTLYANADGIFSNRVLLLVLAYCIVILPYMYQGMRNSLHTIAVRQILESAEILGAGKLYTFWFIIVPNILSGITVSILLSTGIVFGDFAVINLLASSYIETMMMYMAKARNLSGHQTSAVVIIFFAVMGLLAAGMLTLAGRKQTRKEKG